MHLLQLPDEVLTRVLREIVPLDAMQSSHLRDAWNVSLTCQRLRSLATNMLRHQPARRVHMGQDVPYDVVNAVRMPNDVVQGTLMALRTGGESMRAVRLSAMRPHHLRAALKLLCRLRSLKELSFVDVPAGVSVPSAVARRLHTLCIVSARWRTLEGLFEARCAPRKLQLLRFDKGGGCIDILNVVWQRLTRRCSSVDVTLEDSDLSTFMPSMHLNEWHPPLTAQQREQMRVKHKYGCGMFEVMRTVCVRAPLEEHVEEGRFGARTTVVSEWIADYLFRGLDNHQDHYQADGGALVEMHCQCSDDEDSDEERSDDGSMGESLRWRCGSWSEISSAHDILHRKNGTLAQEFVDEVVGTNGIDTLLLTTASAPRCSASSAWTAALSASRLAVAAQKVRVLAVSAAVFAVLREVRLPRGVIEQVGVVDYFVTGSFVQTLPAVLHTLARSGAVRSVWVAESVRLCDGFEGEEKALRRAHTACRYAEAAGLCATGVRGVVEQWLYNMTI